MILILSWETVNVWIVTISFSYFHNTDNPFPQKFTHALITLMVLIWLTFITNTSIN